MISSGNPCGITSESYNKKAVQADSFFGFMKYESLELFHLFQDRIEILHVGAGNNTNE